MFEFIEQMEDNRENMEQLSINEIRNMFPKVNNMNLYIEETSGNEFRSTTYQSDYRIDIKHNTLYIKDDTSPCKLINLDNTTVDACEYGGYLSRDKTVQVKLTNDKGGRIVMIFEQKKHESINGVGSTGLVLENL